MARRILCLVSAVGVLFGCGIQVMGSGITGTVRILPDWTGSPVAGGTVSLCRIGDLVPEGYRVTDGLADWVIGKEERHSDSFLQWAISRNHGTEMLCAVEKKQGAVFRNLQKGLYLVRQEEAADGFSSFLPFLLELPADGTMEITVSPTVRSLAEPPVTGDHPAPILSAMALSLCAVVVMLIVEGRK